MGCCVCAYGQSGVVRLLIARGANINATGDRGNTTLHYAATMGYEEVVAFLVMQTAGISEA